MDIDPEDRQMLADTIYGHPLTAAFEARLAAGLRLRFPLRVVALQHPPGATPPPPSTHGMALRVHPGLTYWLGAPEDPLPLPEPGGAAGPAQGCSSTMGLIRAIQASIVALRRAELERTARRGGGAEMPSAAAEEQLARLATGQLLAGHDAAMGTLQVWLDLVHRRYHRSLNETRRVLVERLAAISGGAAEVPGFSQAFELAMRHVYGTWALRDLLAGFPAQALAVAEHARRSAAREAARTASAPTGEGLAARADAWMEGAYRQSIGLQHVATALGVTASHLARAYRSATGETVGARLLALRLQAAQVMLADTDWPLRTVAAECGFGSVEHFHRTFKKATGSTAHRYRLALARRAAPGEGEGV